MLEPGEPDVPDDVTDSEKSVQILEELLELTRTNQKLLRNPDTKTTEVIESVYDKIDALTRKTENVPTNYRRLRKFHPMMLDELMHFGKNVHNNSYAYLIALSLFRDTYPWIYDIGKELLDIIKSRKSKAEKINAVQDFKDMIEFTTHFLMEFDTTEMSKDAYMFLRELPNFFSKYYEEIIFEDL